MKRIIPYSLIVASFIAAVACSSKSSDNGTSNPGPSTEPGADPGTQPTDQPDAGGTTTTEAGPVQGGEDPSGNPILLGTPRTVRTFTPPGGTPYFVDGPVWSEVRGQLFVALPFASNLSGGKGILTTFKSDGTNYTELRAGDKTLTGVVGNSIDKDGNLISAELKSVTRTPLSAQGVGPVTTIATGYTAANVEAGALVAFDSPNDLVALDDGTIFVTDPGYEVNPRPDQGHLFMIAPLAPAAVIADSYDYNPSPNGIALSKDQKTLFVGFTAPAAGTPPFVRKYTINTDRTLTDGGKLFELPVDSTPDGMATDDSGNIYLALKTGIAVFKATGEPFGGASAKIPQTALDGEPTSLTFGGSDRKSLFVSTKNGKVLELKTKVAGLVQ
ncbi:MAG: Gluconolactonase [Labilithrix sp.]|nr:Gluconolactonase [Labilithrix sp.]